MFSVQPRHLHTGEMLSRLQHRQHRVSKHQQHSQFCCNVAGGKMQPRQQLTAQSNVPAQNLIKCRELIQELVRVVFFFVLFFKVVLN